MDRLSKAIGGKVSLPVKEVYGHKPNEIALVFTPMQSLGFGFVEYR